jgi:hypothetical protein
MKFWIWALFLLFYQGKILFLHFKKFHRSIVHKYDKKNGANN